MHQNCNQCVGDCYTQNGETELANMPNWILRKQFYNQGTFTCSNTNM